MNYGLIFTCLASFHAFTQDRQTDVIIGNWAFYVALLTMSKVLFMGKKEVMDSVDLLCLNEYRLSEYHYIF